MAVTITMPQLGETVTEGTILGWSKQPGDTVAEDEVLLEISTDKVDTEIPSPAAGTLLEILVAEGETVEVGTPLAVIGAEGEDAGSAAEPSAEPEAVVAPVVASPEPEPPAPEPVAPTPAPVTAPVPTTAGAVSGPLSPVVRKLAAEHEIDLSQVAGTGRNGRITRKDVMAVIDAGGTPVPVAGPATASAEVVAFETAPEAPLPPETPPLEVVAAAPAAAAEPQPAKEEPAAAPPPPPPVPASAGVVPEGGLYAGDDVVELDRLRLRIAENLIKAKQTAAHVWTSVEVDYEALERVRQRHKEEFKALEGFSLTYLPFIARATIDALAEFPKVNSSFFLDEGKQVLHRQVNLGIAVDLDQEGLIVTSVKGADGLRLRGIAREVRRLADKARGGQLQPDDISGSTFTLTNPGPFGSFMSAPIINVPNTGILSTDTVVKRPTVVTNADGSDAIAIHHIGYLGLTWDHRAFDGSTAVLFLRRIKENLETWDWEQELQ
jgi:2-oxoglutarate dehydrogenase E2 component (dihydrolipoamide succinyltransferase)